jgi:hypothetical protein
MPGLAPGIHDFLALKDMDGRDKPGHDESRNSFNLTAVGSIYSARRT